MLFILFDTPMGSIGLTEEDGSIVRLYLPNDPTPQLITQKTALLTEAKQQILDYFAGIRREFNLPLAPHGTAFRQRVWAALGEIPYGETRTYGQIAAKLGSPKAVRAVGQANHHNPIPLIIPCHRVVGAGGVLTGYAGGLMLKEALLRLEQTSSPQSKGAPQ